MKVHRLETMAQYCQVILLFAGVRVKHRTDRRLCGTKLPRSQIPASEFPFSSSYSGSHLGTQGDTDSLGGQGEELEAEGGLVNTLTCFYYNIRFTLGVELLSITSSFGRAHYTTLWERAVNSFKAPGAGGVRTTLLPGAESHTSSHLQGLHLHLLHHR